jgi:hypothetical protein
LIDLIQAFIFRILASTHVFTPTEHVAYFDFAVGTPAFMTCCEMLIFSVLFIWAFGPSPYKAARQGGAHKHSRWQSDRRRLQHYRHPAGFRFYVPSHVTQVTWEAIYQRGERLGIFFQPAVSGLDGGQTCLC